MVSCIISRIVILVFGTLYPAYASYKAVKTKNVKEYVKWMMYWIVFALFTCLETVGDIFISWIPFYYELKIVFVLWLLSPATKGASILYRKFIHPQLSKREKEIDTYIAKASDQGYKTFIHIGQKGFNMATNFVMTSAMKGQNKIAEHMRKSYSLNDLSDQTDDSRQIRPQESIDFTDDEEDRDNRTIEESYQQEMMEKDDIHSPQKPKRRTSRKSKDTTDLHEIDEDDELTASTKTRRKKEPTYSHKDASHYGTLPRSKGRSSSRTSVKKVNYSEQE